jgi:uncharacterized protein (TIGR03066 family)
MEGPAKLGARRKPERAPISPPVRIHLSGRRLLEQFFCTKSIAVIIALTLFVCLSRGPAFVARTDEEKDVDKETREKLVGVWEMVRDGKPRGITMEFTKEGKVRMNAGVVGTIVGTYVLDGQTIKITKKIGNEEVREILKIKKLSGAELQVEGEAGKTYQFSRDK